MMKKIELLAPAGTMEAVYAAVFHGADAIYCGGQEFGARAFAGNFSKEEMLEVVRFCHEYNVSVYITMNTLLFENEIDAAMEIVDFYYRIQVDALIIQDLGLLYRVRAQYPDFEIHASTQMHIHNESGIKWLHKIGVQRAVLARETPLDIIKKCVGLGVELEVFAYGALCVSYSGQCLISSITQQRSGNRGTCAQSCRMKYSLENELGESIETEGKYLLSPKDLNTLQNLPELIKTGASSLKIEGRMKRPEYVALIVKTFREAIDSFYETGEYSLTEERLEQLKLMFNRQFTKGFVLNDGPSLINSSRPNHIGITVGKVIDYQHGILKIQLDRILHQGDGLRILGFKEDHGLIANRIEVNNLLVSMAKPGEIVSFSFPKKIEKGNLVVKTTDSHLIKALQQETHQKSAISIEIRYHVEIGKPIQLQLSDSFGKTVVIYSDTIVQEAKNSPVTMERFHEILSKLKDTPYFPEKIEGHFTPFFMPVKMINELRRSAVLALTEERLNRYPSRTSKMEFPLLPLKTKSIVGSFVEVQTVEQYEFLRPYLNVVTLFSGNPTLQAYPEMFAINPVINERSNYVTREKVLCNELGNLVSIDQVDLAIGSYHLNITNSYALEFLLHQGIHAVILSHEVNQDQKKELIDRFKERTGEIAPIIDFIYGHRELMILKHCPINQSLSDGKKFGCSHCRETNYFLVDEKDRHFQLFGDFHCIQHVLEEFPYRKEMHSSSNWIQAWNECGENLHEIVVQSIKNGD